jgi:hypothetical protein
VLEVLIDLDPDAQLPIGLPVDVIFDMSPMISQVKLSDLGLGSADLRTAMLR